MRRTTASTTQAGFTLIEVMVAVLLITIGIFGFAKMQALAISSTQTASGRSIVAMQASSLAAAMHGNRGFWSAVPATFSTFSTSGTTVTDASGTLTAVPAGNCESAVVPATPCNPTQVAARDVKLWATSLTALLPTATSVVNCGGSTAVPPVSCTLTITWTERYVSATGTAATNSRATGGDRTYTLYIEP